MENPTVEFRSPKDDDVSRDPLDRLAEEFAELCRNGQSPSIADFEARRPEDAPRIRKLLEAVSMMEQLRRDSYRSRSMPERMGEYRIIRELGRGGMGVVYEAEQESLGRLVALKAIHLVQMDTKRLQRFRVEAQAIAKLHHTNIVPIFGVGEHEGQPYYAMQYIRGNGLDTIVEAWRRGESPAPKERWRTIAEIGIQAADALHYAHEQGVVHRDIKPANLLIDEQNVVWITDFGLAKLVGGEDLTGSGDVIGTLRYLAPESLRGQSDARSDVYSLGLTLYELITLAAPFGESSPSELLRQVSEGDIPHPRRIEPAIPRDLETIVLKAIAREPDHRYRSAHALSDDLKRFLEDRPIRARRATWIESAWRWSRRNKALATLMTTAAASLFLAAVAGWSFYVGASAALDRESRLLEQAKAAKEQSDVNVKLSLEVFGDLFEKLAPARQIASPPLGMLGRRGPGMPPRPGPGRRGGPPLDDGGPFMDQPPGRFFGGSPGRRGGSPRGDYRPPRDEEGGPRTPFDDLPPFDGPHGPPGGRGQAGGIRLALSEANTSLLKDILTFYDRFAQLNAKNQNPTIQSEAAWAYRKVGALYHNLDRENEAEAAYSRAIEMFEDVIRQVPNDPEIRFRLVATCLMSDPWTADPSALATIEKRLRLARELIVELVEKSPESPDYKQSQLQIEAKLGAVLQRFDRSKEAEESYRRGEAIVDKLVEQFPDSLPWRLDRVAILQALSGLQIGDGRPDEARRGLDKATADLKSLTNRRIMAPPILENFEKLSSMYSMIGDSERANELKSYLDELDFRRRGDRRPPPEDHPRE